MRSAGALFATTVVLVSATGFAGRTVLAADAPSVPAANVPAAEASFAEAVRGEWFVLLAQRHHRNLAETEPARHASRVRIAADRLEWGAGGESGPWLVADCRRAPPEEPTAAKLPPRDPHELLATTTGSDSPGDGVARFARWKLTDYGVLFVCIHVAEQVWPTPGHKANYHGWGAGTLLLVLSRTAPPPFSKPDPDADAQALLGTWDLLTELDDSMANRTQPGGTVEFTREKVFKKPATGPARMSGRYALLPPQGKLGRFDVALAEHHGQVDVPLGRCPSLYAFCGPDLLLVVYPESGWKKELPEAERRAPEKLQSDGDRNMWILRRRKGAPSGAARESSR